jgi:hypothetical protein
VGEVEALHVPSTTSGPGRLTVQAFLRCSRASPSVPGGDWSARWSRRARGRACWMMPGRAGVVRLSGGASAAPALPARPGRLSSRPCRRPRSPWPPDNTPARRKHPWLDHHGHETAESRGAPPDYAVRLPTLRAPEPRGTGCDLGPLTSDSLREALKLAPGSQPIAARIAGCAEAPDLPVIRKTWPVIG